MLSEDLDAMMHDKVDRKLEELKKEKERSKFDLRKRSPPERRKSTLQANGETSNFEMTA